MFRIILFMAVYLISVPAISEANHPSASATHTVHLGSFYQTTEGGLSGYERDRLPDRISLDFLGIDEKELVPYFSYEYRMNESWSVEVFYNDYAQEATTGASREFKYFFMTVPVNATVITQFTFDTLGVRGVYDFIETDSYALSLGFGLHMMNFTTSVTSIVDVNDLSASRTVVDKELLAPLPNLNLSGYYALSDSILLKFNTGWFSASYGRYSGDIGLNSIGIEFALTENLGFGAEYQHTIADATKEGDIFTSIYDLEYHGPAVYFIGYF